MLIARKKSPMFKFVLSVLACACLGVSTLAPATSAQAQEDRRPIVLTYVPAFKAVDVDALPYDRLTHICHAFATATPEGHFKAGQYMPAPSLIEQAHANGVKVLLSIGGANSDAQLASVAADPEKLQRFVDNIVDFMSDHGYDGVDVDWEFPESEASAAGMIALVEMLHERLDGLERKSKRSYLMSRAVGGGWAYRHIPTEVFVDNFDFLNVMGYDCTGPWLEVAGHHSPLVESAESEGKSPATVEGLVNHWLVERGVPASKIVLGLPAYGRGFKTGERYSTVGKDPAVHTSYGYDQLVALEQAGWTTQRLENGELWLMAPDGSEVIGFDDPESIAMKTRWAQSRGLAGVFFWEASQDLLPDGSTPLINAASDALNSEPQ